MFISLSLSDDSLVKGNNYYINIGTPQNPEVYVGTLINKNPSRVIFRYGGTEARGLRFEITKREFNKRILKKTTAKRNPKPLSAARLSKLLGIEGNLEPNITQQASSDIATLVENAPKGLTKRAIKGLNESDLKLLVKGLRQRIKSLKRENPKKSLYILRKMKELDLTNIKVKKVPIQHQNETSHSNNVKATPENLKKLLHDIGEYSPELFRKLQKIKPENIISISPGIASEKTAGYFHFQPDARRVKMLFDSITKKEFFERMKREGGGLKGSARQITGSSQRGFSYSRVDGSALKGSMGDAQIGSFKVPGVWKTHYTKLYGIPLNFYLHTVSGGGANIKIRYIAKTPLQG